MNKAEKIAEEKKIQDRIYRDKMAASNDLNKKYRDFRRNVNSLSPSEKAMRLEVFKLLYWSIKKDTNISDEIIRKIISIQEKFFEENKNRIYCDPILFKEVFGEESKSFNPALVMIERVILEDIKYSKLSTC